MRGFSYFALVFLLSAGAASAALAPSAEIVSRKRNPVCQELDLNRELTIYKDPALFLQNLGIMMHVDPHTTIDDMLDEGPVLTRRKGKLKVQYLEDEFREFKNPYFRMMTPNAQWMMTEAGKKAGVAANQPILTIPVKLCGGAEDSYSDSVGFIVKSELEYAKNDQREPGASLPPSVYPNPIPKLSK